MPNPSSGNDWIELYNTTDQSIDLKDWILKDTTSEMLKINEATISAKGFMVFEVSNRLNKSEDLVSLYKDQSQDPIDTCDYNQYYGNDISIGKSPDGEGDCLVLEGVSRETVNGSPVPTVTLTPSPSLKPTSTPEPTNTPKPTITPKPTSTPKPINTLEPTESSKISNTSKYVNPTIRPSVTVKKQQKKSAGSVLGLHLPTASPSASSEKELEDSESTATGKKRGKVFYLFFVLGGLSLAAGLFSAFKISKPN